MAVGETTDDTKGVNNMWYVILSLVAGGTFAGYFGIITGKGILKYMKMGFKPDGTDIMMITLFAYVSISLFGLAVYCLI